MTRLTLIWHLKTIVEGVGEEGVGLDIPVHQSDHYDRFLAIDAVQSDDPVAYLDAVANDPSRQFDCRTDAAELLGHHILERRLLSLTSFPSVRHSLDDQRSEWIESDTTRTAGPGRWQTIECPNCGEREVLYDWDEDTAACHCGEKLTLPTYDW